LHRLFLAQNHQLDGPVADAGVQIVNPPSGRVGDEMDDGGGSYTTLHLSGDIADLNQLGCISQALSRCW